MLTLNGKTIKQVVWVGVVKYIVVDATEVSLTNTIKLASLMQQS